MKDIAPSTPRPTAAERIDRLFRAALARWTASISPASLELAFLMAERWWEEATHGVEGVEKHHAEVAGFVARQWLDMGLPGNQLAANPVVLKQTVEHADAPGRYAREP